MIDLWAILAAIGAGIIAMIAAFAKGRKSAKVDAKLDQAKATEKAHERLNNAKTGGDDDDANIGSLRDFVAKHGKR